MNRAAVLLALLAATACGGKAKTDSDQPGSDRQGPPELAVLDRFEVLDDQVEASRGRCPRLASALDSWLDANAEPSLEGGRLAEVEQHLQRIFERLVDAVTTCQGKGGVDQAYARLDAFLESS